MVTLIGQRNAIYISPDNMMIDMEVNSEEFGWQPITINLADNDPARHIIQIKQWLSSNLGVIADYVAPPPPTQRELDEAAEARDVGTIRAAVEKLAFIQIEVIDKLLADGILAGSDFTPDVRQAYQDIKVIVDRIK